MKSVVFFLALVVSLIFPVQTFHFQNVAAETDGVAEEALSWYFHGMAKENLGIFGNPTSQRGLVGQAITLDGKNDYLTVKNIENKTMPADLTLSAWVKPDYSKASNVLTVFHSKNSFELTIENYGSVHLAKFSIFDGKEWTSVSSSTEIPQEWTNIVATYTKDKISLHINGNLDSEKLLYETTKYYAYGRQVEKISKVIHGPTLSEDVFIGATKSSSGLGKFFAGQLDEAQFYLTPSLVITGRPELKIDNTYVLSSDECYPDNTLGCRISLTIHTVEERDDKVAVSFEGGTVSFDGVDYTVKEKDWSGTIPLRGGQATFGGPATSSDGSEIRIILVGIFSENTPDGPTFRTSGNIKTSNTQYDLSGQFGMKSTKPIYKGLPKPPEAKPDVPPHILLMTRHFTSTYLGNYFKFDVKVFYEEQNVFKDYYQLGGEVQDATITLKIAAPDGKVLKTFEGHTDKNGHYGDEFVVPKTIDPGVYSVIVTAVKDGVVDTNDLATVINYPPSRSTPQQNPNGPKITLIGDNPQTVLRNDPYVELNATATDVEDGDLTGSIIIDSSSVDTSTVGSYSVTYTVTDSSGITSTVTRTINVVAGNVPVITLTGANPQSIIKNLPYSELGAMATDVEDGDISGSISIDSTNVNTSLSGTYSVTYTVTDSAGNTSTETRTVNIIAGDAPVITLTGANPQTVEVGTPYSELGATAADAEDGNISGSIVIDSSAVNSNVLGTYDVTYDVTDSSGNTDSKTRTVNVVDNTNPIITLSGTNPQNILKNHPYSELGATATDNYDGDITASIATDASSVNTSVVGSYSVTYSVTDSSGNTDSKTRTVNVVAGGSPVITLNGANPQTIIKTSPYVELGATAVDGEDGDLTSSIAIDSSAVNTNLVGTYSVTYTVTDSSGNSDVKTRTVDVILDNAPVITLSGANPQTVEVGTPYSELGATAADAEDGDISGSIVIDSSAVNSNVLGTYDVTYDVTDSHGQTDHKVRTVSVVDTTHPVVTLSGSNPQTVVKNYSYVEAGASCVDNYDGDISGSIITSGSVDTATIGSYTKTYSCADSSSNSDSETRTVNVIAGNSPVITLTGANPQTVQYGSPYTELGATATDTEDGNITSSIITDSSSVNTASVGSYSVTYSVTDTSGNSDLKTRTVNVVAIVSGSPTGLSATASSPSQINLSWTAPVSNGGSAITGYKIERESPVGGGWSTLVANTGSTSTTYQNTGLSASTQYNYRVSAINSVGTGDASNAANASTPSSGPTRLYFSRNAAAPVSPSFDGWDETDQSAGYQLLTAKSGSQTIGVGTRLSWTSGNNQLDRQYVSPPMNAGISFSSTTIKLQLACREFNNADNSVPRMSAKIVSEDGATLRQTLLTIANYGTTTEYVNNNTPRNVQFANGDPLAGAYVTQVGDRLIIEIGHSDSVGATPEAQCRYGARTGTDLGENDSDQNNNLIPWVEVSNTVTFQAGP